jgi:methylated-DNA-[protein]-cysteine S-methyltransferase
MGWAMGLAAERSGPAGQPAVFESPVGWLGVAVSPAGLCQVLLPNSAARARRGASHAAPRASDAECTARAAAQIMEYLNGQRREFDLPLDLSRVSGEMRTVLDELCASAPYGKAITYGELARRSRCPGGARGVGQIMARNPLPLVIPCHRVVAAADLGGYGGGLALKRRLLRLEGGLTEQLSLLGDA